MSTNPLLLVGYRQCGRKAGRRVGEGHKGLFCSLILAGQHSKAEILKTLWPLPLQTHNWMRSTLNNEHIPSQRTPGWEQFLGPDFQPLSLSYSSWMRPSTGRMVKESTADCRPRDYAASLHWWPRVSPDPGRILWLLDLLLKEGSFLSHP